MLQIEVQGKMNATSTTPTQFLNLMQKEVRHNTAPSCQVAQ
jgi:hypothetical protein